MAGRKSKEELEKLKKIRTSDFKIEIGQEFKDNKRDFVITDRKYRVRENNNKNGKIYISNMKWYKYKCNKCGWNEGWIDESHLLSERGCACCRGMVVKGMNDINTVAPFMLDLGVSYEDSISYTIGSGKKIEITCPDCGNKKRVVVQSIYKYKSISCICGDNRSYISKIMVSVLNQLNVNFETEIKFKWCEYFNPYKNKETYGIYDFVLEDLKLIIETDGDFHRTDNKRSGQKLEESQFIDFTKDKLAHKNGYKVIRISDDGDVEENILNSELANYFDLTNIDWKCANNLALKNTTKEICEMKNNNPSLTTSEIGKIVGMTSVAVRRSLIKGSKYGWCKYNGKEEWSKNSSKNGINNRKKIKVYKDGMFLGVYEGMKELERRSEELFGTKLFSTFISSVCLGKREKYKNFTFEYAE